MGKSNFEKQLKRAESSRTKSAKKLLKEDSGNADLANLKTTLKKEREQKLNRDYPILEKITTTTSSQTTKTISTGRYSTWLSTTGSLFDLQHTAANLPNAIKDVVQQLTDANGNITEQTAKNAIDFIIKADLILEVVNYRLNFLTRLNETAAQSSLGTFLDLAKLMLELEAQKHEKNNSRHQNRARQLKESIIGFCRVNEIALDNSISIEQDDKDFKETIHRAIAKNNLSVQLEQASQIIEKMILPVSIPTSVAFQIWNEHATSRKRDPLRNPENFISPIVEWKSITDRLAYLAKSLGNSNNMVHDKLIEQSHAITRTGFDVIEDSISNEGTNFLAIIEREIKSLHDIESRLEENTSSQTNDKDYSSLKMAYDKLEEFMRLRDWYERLTSGFGINILAKACMQTSNAQPAGENSLLERKFLGKQSTTLLLSDLNHFERTSSNSSSNSSASSPDNEDVSPTKFVNAVQGLAKKYNQIDKEAKDRKLALVEKIAGTIPDELQRKVDKFKSETQRFQHCDDKQSASQTLSNAADDLATFLYHLNTMMLNQPSSFKEVFQLLKEGKALPVPSSANTWGGSEVFERIKGEIEQVVDREINSLQHLASQNKEHKNELVNLELVRRFATEWVKQLAQARQPAPRANKNAAPTSDSVAAPVGRERSNSDSYGGLNNLDPGRPRSKSLNTSYGAFEETLLDGTSPSSDTKPNTDGYGVLISVPETPYPDANNEYGVMAVPGPTRLARNNTLIGIHNVPQPDFQDYGPVPVPHSDASANSADDHSRSSSPVSVATTETGASVSTTGAVHSASTPICIEKKIKKALSNLKRKNEISTNSKEIVKFLNGIYELRAEIIGNNEKYANSIAITHGDIQNYINAHYSQSKEKHKIAILMMHSVLEKIKDEQDNDLSTANMRQMLGDFVTAFKLHKDCKAPDDHRLLAVDIDTIYDVALKNNIANALKAKAMKYTDALEKAAPTGDEPTIRRLLYQGAHIDARLTTRAEDVRKKTFIEASTALQIAARHGNTSAVCVMLEVKDTQVSDVNNKLSAAHIGSALCMAAAYGHEKTVKAILEHCDRKMRNAYQVKIEDFQQALIQAARHDHPPVINTLLSFDFNNTLGIKDLTDNDNNDALRQALENYFSDCQKGLLCSLAKRIDLAKGNTKDIIKGDLLDEVAKDLKLELRRVILDKITKINSIDDVLKIYDECKAKDHFINQHRNKRFHSFFFKERLPYGEAMVMLHLQGKALELLDPAKLRTKKAEDTDFSGCKALYDGLSDDGKRKSLDSLFEENLSGLAHGGYKKPYEKIIPKVSGNTPGHS